MSTSLARPRPRRRVLAVFGALAAVSTAVVLIAGPAQAWPIPDTTATGGVCVNGVPTPILWTAKNKETGFNASPATITNVVVTPAPLTATVFTPAFLRNTGSATAMATTNLPSNFVGKVTLTYVMSWSGPDGSDTRPGSAEVNVTTCTVPTTRPVPPTTPPPSLPHTDPTTTTTVPAPTTTTTVAPTTTTSTTKAPTTTTPPPTVPPSLPHTDPTTTTTTVRVIEYCVDGKIMKVPQGKLVGPAPCVPFCVNGHGMDVPSGIDFPNQGETHPGACRPKSVTPEYDTYCVFVNPPGVWITTRVPHGSVPPKDSKPGECPKPTTTTTKPTTTLPVTGSDSIPLGGLALVLIFTGLGVFAIKRYVDRRHMQAS